MKLYLLLTRSDCAYVSKWTNIFGVAQFFGFIFAPIAGLFIDTLEKYFSAKISLAQRNGVIVVTFGLAIMSMLDLVH